MNNLQKMSILFSVSHEKIFWFKKFMMNFGLQFKMYSISYSDTGAIGMHTEIPKQHN